MGKLRWWRDTFVQDLFDKLGGEKRSIIHVVYLSVTEPGVLEFIKHVQFVLDADCFNFNHIYRHHTSLILCQPHNLWGWHNVWRISPFLSPSPPFSSAIGCDTQSQSNISQSQLRKYAARRVVHSLSAQLYRDQYWGQYICTEVELYTCTLTVHFWASVSSQFYQVKNFQRCGWKS